MCSEEFIEWNYIFDNNFLRLEFNNNNINNVFVGVGQFKEQMK